MPNAVPLYLLPIRGEPEPGTLLLLGFAAPVVLRLSRRK
ncbi:PEP-CTERM sorting domain-containing protein [Armatimonas sp.]